MPKLFDLVGEKFGDLTVKESAGTDKQRNKLWLCECVCGETVKVATRQLTSGEKTNCGCKSIRKQTLINKKFGDLTVKEFVGSNKYRNKLWLCECTCGTKVEVSTDMLTSGKKAHCGCKSKWKQNLINKKFGDLTVKEFAGLDKRGNRLWLCECTCGNKIKVTSNLLTSGKKAHCGCKSIKAQNLINQKFGDLTVKESAGTDKQRNKLWLCECTCGETVITTSHNLTSGRKTHCGCKRCRNRIFLDQRGTKKKNANLYKRYCEKKKKEKFIMPSLEEIEIWDKKFTALELVKRKLKEIKNVNELNSFLTLLSGQRIKV